MALGTALSLALATLGVVVAVHFGRFSARQVAERASLRTFLRVRQHLGRSGLELAVVAAAHGRDHTTDTPYALSRPGWMLPRPVPLDGLELTLDGAPDAPGAADDALDRLTVLRRYLPVDATGRRLDRYHEAVDAFDRPPLWFDAATYRLLNVTPRPGGLTLRLAATRYWTCFDFAEGLRHEAAHVHLASRRRRIAGPFRRALGGPFDLARRHCGLGFATLTIRRGAEGATFFLHRRGTDVAVGQNETSLVPAGEFQPSDDSRHALRHDLDLWSAMMREYAEELLDLDEVRHGAGAPIDYDSRSPFRELQAARAAGLVRPWLLGIGLDPASWKAQLLTVCVIDGPTFDAVFAGMTARNREGILEVPTHHRGAAAPLTGWAFTEDTVRGYLADPHLNATARIALDLAWRHRDHLLGG